MSLLPPEVTQALGQLTQGLQSADNVTRQQAEQQLAADWLEARPDVLLMGLVEQIQGSQDATVCSIYHVP